MRLIGTIKSMHENKGYGILEVEKGGEELHFKQSSLTWTRTDTPRKSQRLYYERGVDSDGKPCAVNLQPV